MNRRALSTITAALLVLHLAAPSVIAQDTPASTTWSQEDTLRIVKQVQKNLSGLNRLSVFDWLTFGIQGKKLILNGYASRPVLKDDAGRAVKGIPGVESVDNKIEVLPLSPNDDRIRASIYNRIYTQPSLRKYNANQGTLARAIGPGGRSASMMAGGITNNPPLGYHAIHIIVKNGNVTLFGAVLNQMDADIAEVQANTAPGAFSIDSNLVVEGSTSGSASK
jgi:hyperosmotically inducible periplasmic protein